MVSFLLWHDINMTKTDPISRYTLGLQPPEWLVLVRARISTDSFWLGTAEVTIRHRPSLANFAAVASMHGARMDNKKSTHTKAETESWRRRTRQRILYSTSRTDRQKSLTFLVRSSSVRCLRRSAGNSPRLCCSSQREEEQSTGIIMSARMCKGCHSW